MTGPGQRAWGTDNYDVWMFAVEALPPHHVVEAPTGHITISPATFDDVEDYVHLHIDLLNITYAHLFDPDFAPQRRAEFKERCGALREEIHEAALAGTRDESPFRQHWVARSHLGTMVAVASAGDGVDEWEHQVLGDAWRPPATTWCIDHLYVVPGLHGSGLAQHMLELLVPHQHGYLWVFSDNQRAVRFYRRGGFVADGLRAPSGPTWGNSMMDRMVRATSVGKPAGMDQAGRPPR